MGTSYSIKYFGEQTIEQEKVDFLLDSFNQVLSTYLPKSHISKFNHDYNFFLQSSTHPWLYRVAIKSKQVWLNTGGYFDISAAPLFNAYGFGEEQKQEINAYLRDSLLQLVGMDKLIFTDKTLQKVDVRTQINANAIAKGYGVDILAQFLDGQGVQNYLIEIGGELRAKGKNAHGEWWSIGINKPASGASIKSQIKQLELQNQSIATSGNYRNYYQEKGKKIVHTINPKTGLAEENNMVSASILAKNCLEADAYATAVMAMGFPKCLSVFQHKKISAYLIYEKNGLMVDTTIGILNILK